MSIKLTDELIASTIKGKLASAQQIFMDGDKENLQQVGERTAQLETAVKNISATGGASVASAVSYDNDSSGMTAVTIQGAVDELYSRSVILSENEYNTLELKDEDKFYFVYED